jgi:hypothetical protein
MVNSVVVHQVLKRSSAQVSWTSTRWTSWSCIAHAPPKVDPQVFRRGPKSKHLVGSAPAFMHCSCTAHSARGWRCSWLMVFMVDGGHGWRWSWLMVFMVDSAHGWWLTVRMVHGWWCSWLTVFMVDGAHGWWCSWLTVFIANKAINKPISLLKLPDFPLSFDPKIIQIHQKLILIFCVPPICLNARLNSGQYTLTLLD